MYSSAAWENLYYNLHHHYNRLEKELESLNSETTNLQQTLNDHLIRQQQLLQESIEDHSRSQSQEKKVPKGSKSKQLKKKKRKILKKKKEKYQQSKKQGVHKCPYQNCQKIYKSGIAVNLHIKLYHNGGTKKERQAYAKKLIGSQEGICQPPQQQLTLPSNFMEQFRRSYNYKKKYNM